MKCTCAENTYDVTICNKELSKHVNPGLAREGVPNNGHLISVNR